MAAAKTCMEEMANAYRDTVLPVMEDLRKAVDALEVLLPSTMQVFAAATAVTSSSF